MPRPLIVTLAAVAGLAVAAAGAWFWLGGDEPRPATLRSERTSALYSLIDTRQADSKPLTVDEVFSAGNATLGTLRRVSAEQLDGCDEALWGVTAAGCTQALRAAYEGPAGVAGQFVIFNLADGRAADALVTALGKDGFVRPAVSLDAAHSRATVRAMGHYVTVSWAGTPGKSGTDLVPTLIELDKLGQVVQARVVAAT
ncbi:hypothetical protein GCM10010149_27030 [Nonomuraea roseoviolacea subsp. roseoviolacea]|uniref:Uncharacterized protein n=1 Tax=Nonomuraea roseoviolacea subsp. carminata TaxID=160689 RepID=A0ABT1JR59_9ACTN|nr:hypothetical protein [Nonomuraea roseoviolacea]MCP2344207.1 hypothetical protein [Nonomuraea roseoviolacea subsp. carminata]